MHLCRLSGRFEKQDYSVANGRDDIPSTWLVLLGGNEKAEGEDEVDTVSCRSLRCEDVTLELPN